MNNLKKILFPLLALGVFAAQPATAELEVVTVSMQKLFDGYHKSADANENLQSIQQQAQAEAQEKQQSLQEMADSVRAMQEELENPVLSEASKEEKQAEIQAKIQEVQQRQREYQQWQERTMNELQARNQEVRQGLIDEIVKVVNDIALKEYMADLVFDTSDILGSGVPTVLYADSDLDITDKVLLKLNENAPKD
jgi:outer membrane protein